MATRTDSESAPKGPREVVPQFYSNDNGIGYPLIDPAPQYIWAHHRRRWTVVDGRVVPELAKIPLTSGCNRVLRTADGRIKFADTQAFLQDRHWKIIPHTAAPNGRTYLLAVDTLVGERDIRPAVISCFEIAHAGESRTEWDLPAYADWLERLVDTGVITPITPHRAAEKLTAAKTALSKAELKLAKGQASSGERVDALKAEVAAWTKKSQGMRGAAVAPRELDPELSDEIPEAIPSKPRASTKPPKGGE